MINKNHRWTKWYRENLHIKKSFSSYDILIAAKKTFQMDRTDRQLDFLYYKISLLQKCTHNKNSTFFILNLQGFQFISNFRNIIAKLYYKY